MKLFDRNINRKIIYLPLVIFVFVIPKISFSQNDRWLKKAHKTDNLVHKKFLTLILLLLNLGAYAQEWKRFYPDWPGCGSFTYNVEETYDMGYITGNVLKKPDNTWPGWIFKTDINGNMLWYRLIDGFTDSDFINFDVTNDGGFIAGGRYWNEAKQVRDAYVMKFNACAEPEWCSFLPVENNNESWIQGVTEMDDGSYICERFKGIWDHHYRWSLIRLSAHGDVIWSNYYDLNMSYFAQIDLVKMIKTSDNCVLVTSSVYDTINEEGYLSEMPYWYKVDIDGNLLWDTKWNLLLANTPGEARSTAEDGNGNYYSGGFKCPWKHSNIFKLSNTGDTLYDFRFYDTATALADQINTIEMLNDSMMLIGSQYVLPNNDYSGWSLNITDTNAVVKKRFSEYDSTIFVKTIITKDNKIVCAGLTPSPDTYGIMALYKFNMNLEYDSIYTAPRTYDSLCSHAIVSDTIPMPGNCRVVSSPKPDPLGDVQALVLSPNPATSYVSIGIPEFYASTGSFALGKVQQFRPLTGKVQLIMYNLAGNKVFEETLDASDKNHSIDVSSYPAGMYMLQLSRQNKTVATGKLVIVK